MTRWRLDAARYEPPPPDSASGRPRQKGKPLPALPPFRHHEPITWQPLTLACYNPSARPIEAVTGTVCWFQFG
jgi:hypothetical protein